MVKREWETEQKWKQVNRREENYEKLQKQKTAVTMHIGKRERRGKGRAGRKGERGRERDRGETRVTAKKVHLT